MRGGRRPLLAPSRLTSDGIRWWEDGWYGPNLERLLVDTARFDTSPRHPPPAGRTTGLDLIGSISRAIGRGADAEPTGGAVVFGSARGRSYTIEGARLSSKDPHFPPHSNNADMQQRTKGWEGYRVLEGGHLPEGTLYSKIDFRLTGLPDW